MGLETILRRKQFRGRKIQIASEEYAELTMGLGQILGRTARELDRQYSLMAWLSGEPRHPKGGFDLEGEKLVDWGWICVNLPKGPKQALEIGSGRSPIIPAMLALGYDVTAVDLSDDTSHVFSSLKFHFGDFQELSCNHGFDVIVLCSVVEHIGLSGRYNSREEPDGDLKAMRKALELLNPDGQLFLTIPVGKDVIHRPWHRVYGQERLKSLLDGFSVLQSRYLIKKPWGPWYVADEGKALSVGRDIQRYALGEFILQKQIPG
jgi:SAM-dependent methyltransferase